MSTTGLACAALAAALVGPPQDPPPAGRQEPRPALVRVAPVAPAPETAAAPFDGPLWSERLRDPDLDRREPWFDAIVTLASRDTLALFWLLERSRDASDLELSWTARMALRAVEDGRVRPVWPLLPEVALPSRTPDPAAVAEHLDALFGLRPGGSHAVVEISCGATGCEVIVTRRGAEGESRRVYRGESLEALLGEHPELGEQGGPGRDRNAQGSGVAGAPLATPGGGSGDPAVPPSISPHRILGVYVSELPASVRAHYSIENGVGLQVVGVQPRSYAHALGVGPGSVVLELNGRRVTTQESISEILSTREPWEPLHLVWYDPYGQLHRETWRGGGGPAPSGTGG